MNQEHCCKLNAKVRWSGRYQMWQGVWGGGESERGGVWH